jgi:geranylgeranyl reductase family protein
MTASRATGMYDVAVVGAGPAGAAAALGVLRARPGSSVLLVDREQFPRDKCCGDGIAPHVVDVLDGLGAGDVVADWTPSHYLAVSRGEQAATRRMRRPVWVIPRKVFDARLVARAVDTGAELVRHRVRHVVRAADGFTIDGQYRARLVVGADGVHSAVRASTVPAAPRDRAFAIRGYVPTEGSHAGLMVISYGSRPQPSYAWAFDRGDGLSNVGYGELVSATDRPSREFLLEQLATLLPGSVVPGARWLGHHLPLTGWSWGREQPDGGVLLAGDAAGLVNPLTGEGIYYAVATGALAGAAAATALGRGRPQDAGASYRRAVRRRLGPHIRHTWVATRLTRSTALLGAGIRTAARDPRAFDDIAELGLGDGLLTPRLLGNLAGGVIAHTTARLGRR